MTKKPPEISENINATAKHFEISKDDVLNFKKQSNIHNEARLTALFVAANSGYSNDEIATAMNYKSAGTVSAKFTKAHNHFATPMEDTDMTFRRDCRAVAKMLHVALPE
jgi:uncharacterized membrane protein (UPF0182 family)